MFPFKVKKVTIVVSKNIAICLLIISGKVMGFPFYHFSNSISVMKQNTFMETLMTVRRKTNINDKSIATKLHGSSNRSCDSDQRPKRLISKQFKSKSRTMFPSSKTSSIDQCFQYWGVEMFSPETKQNLDQPPTFPNTVETVAESAFHAISSTLYCKNKADPNIVSNAMAISMNERRPAGFMYWPEGRDVGRLGVEIDGARFLENVPTDSLPHYRSLPFKQGSGHKQNVQGPTAASQEMYSNTVKEGRALRKVALVLASKLSQKPWTGIENERAGVDTATSDEKKISKEARQRKRLVAVYFNTLQQTLLACQELKVLQNIANMDDQHDATYYDNIQILCLDQDDLPSELTTTTGRKKSLSQGVIDPSKGLVLIVQPSDSNVETKPPSPKIGALTNLQKVLARASISQIPAIVLSPRLNEQAGAVPGLDQSGYQKSSTYGGFEPPKGPTPWILRDFIPPVFSWVGSALELDESALTNNRDETKGNAFLENFHYSRIVLCQSLMESGHPWRLFAIEHDVGSDVRTTGLQGTSGGSRIKTNYRYLASTKTSSGRPNQDILRIIFSAWKQKRSKLKHRDTKQDD